MASSFSKNLRLLRKERHMTQIETAEVLGISQALLSLYENDARVPNMAFVSTVCDYYGVTADYLMGRTGVRERLQEEPGPDETEEGRTVPLQDDLTELTDSITILFRLLDQLPGGEAAESAKEYLRISVFRLFRALSSAAPDSIKNLQKYDTTDYIRSACTAEMTLKEISYSKALEKAAATQDAVPDCGYPALKEAYPKQYQSLFNLLFEENRRMEDLLNTRRKS